MHIISDICITKCTVELVCYGHLGTNCKCPYYQGVLIFQVTVYDKAVPFGTITKCVDYAGVLIFKCPDWQVPLYVCRYNHVDTYVCLYVYMYVCMCLWTWVVHLVHVLLYVVSFFVVCSFGLWWSRCATTRQASWWYIHVWVQSDIQLSQEYHDGWV